MALLSLTYVSFATRDMTKDDIEDILRTSRKNNQTQNITGMLLYRNRYFIQALEGEEDAVTALYKRIEQDDRHNNVLMVSQNRIDERNFGEWSMGFKNLDDIDANAIEGYTDFLERPFDADALTQNPSQAKTLLNAFRSGANF